MRILDVGSGSNPLFHQTCEVVHVDINEDSPHLEVICDAYHLPFVSNSFLLVHASHILEHIEKPLCFMRELKTVSSNQVIVKVPNGGFYVASTMSPEHLFSWNEFTLSNLLHRIFDCVTISSRWKLHRKKRSFLQNKLRTLKFLLLSKFFGNDELYALCTQG